MKSKGVSSELILRLFSSYAYVHNCFFILNQGQRGEMMNVKKEDMLLYGITDRAWLNGRSLSEVVEESLKGGVTILQIREKNLSNDEFLEEAKR